jgi:hypothetical protein
LALDQFTFIVLTCGAVLVWYFTGLAYNRRLLADYWKKIRPELISLDASPKLNAVRASSLTVHSTSLSKHLKQVSVSVIVVGRQNPFSLLLARIQKHDDIVSIRADFMKKPREEFELLSKTYPLTSNLLKNAFRDWNCESVPGTNFVCCWKSQKLNLSAFKGLDRILRVSVRTDSPHLLLTLRAERRSTNQLARLPDFIESLTR